MVFKLTYIHERRSKLRLSYFFPPFPSFIEEVGLFLYYRLTYLIM